MAKRELPFPVGSVVRFKSDKRTLHEVKPKITRWLSIWNSAYFKGDKVYSHLTEADARNSRPVPDKTTKAAIVKIEFEEGEGL